MAPAVATRAASRDLFYLIAQRDNPVALFRGLKLAPASLRGICQPSSGCRRCKSPADPLPRHPRLWIKRRKDFRARTEGLSWLVAR